MTNYEKYKGEFIELLATNVVGACSRIYGLRTNKETCPLGPYREVCDECEMLNKQWLNEEVKIVSPSELKTGDKLSMRKFGKKIHGCTK